MTPPDNFLTPEQLATRWGLKTGTLSNWRRERRGPAFVRLGTGPRARVVYRMADVLNFEKEQQR